MSSPAAAWHEGYQTALHDFDVVPTEAKIATAAKNPYYAENGVRGLTAYEIFELRNALSYAFRDDPDEWSIQSEIVVTIVERILARRPGRAS